MAINRIWHDKVKIFLNTGGKGVRLRPLTYDLPKPMIPVAGKPVLHHLIDWGKSYGINEFVFLNGYLFEKIEEYFGDGSKLGVKIHHSNEPKPLGTAGPLKFAQKHVDGTFVLIQGDVICKVDIKKMIEYHKQKGGLITIFLHESDHPEDSDVIDLAEDGTVRKVIHKPGNRDFGCLTNAGLFVIEPKILDYIKEGEKLTMEKELYPRLMEAGEKIVGYVSDDYIKDMGTADRLETVEDYLEPKKAAFIDKDGVICVDKQWMFKMSDFEFYPGSVEALQKLSRSDWKIIIVTNAPQVGRGICTKEQYEAYKDEMLAMFEEKGIHIDKLIYCPHHPRAGKGEYLIECDCRKPKPGMILSGANALGIDLSQSYMVGDRRGDMNAGRAAGCKTILVQTGEGGQGGDTDFDAKPDVTVKNLLEAVDHLLNKA
jgi:D,D-heptose 1,7-bisphosphate phosphatase